jgi:hypothetical protein
MPGFFPETLNGWFSLLVEVGVLLLAAWGVMVTFIRKPLIEQINGVGSRVKALEHTDGVHSGKLEVIERHDERRTFQHDSLRERLAKVEGDHEKLQNQVATGMAEFRERLASMESTLKFIARQVGGGKSE